jgi:hypothetical protein
MEMVQAAEVLLLVFQAMATMASPLHKQVAQVREEPQGAL